MAFTSPATSKVSLGISGLSRLTSTGGGCGGRLGGPASMPVCYRQINLSPTVAAVGARRAVASKPVELTSGHPAAYRRIHRPRDNAGDLTSTTVEWTWFRSVTPTKIQGLFQDPERFLRWPHNKKRNVTVWSLSVCKAPTQAKLFTFIGNRSLFQCVPGPHHFSGLTMIFWVWAPWMDTEKTKSSQRRYVSAVISTTCQ